jgi:hypothetical protein
MYVRGEDTLLGVGTLATVEKRLATLDDHHVRGGINLTRQAKKGCRVNLGCDPVPYPIRSPAGTLPAQSSSMTSIRCILSNASDLVMNDDQGQQLVILQLAAQSRLHDSQFLQHLRATPLFYFRKYLTKAIIASTKTMRNSNHQTPMPSIIPPSAMLSFLSVLFVMLFVPL